MGGVNENAAQAPGPRGGQRSESSRAQEASGLEQKTDGVERPGVGAEKTSSKGA